MDIAYYLSELLEQLGEVNVPGLGKFTRVKVDGYYNGDEGRFYPPASKLIFDQQHATDDILTQYIGVKKRISLASSKYFTEKYISGLKQEVMGREIPFAELGSLYFANGRILFRAAQSLPDPEFYGYPKIDLNKISSETVYHYDEPVIVPEPVEEDLPVLVSTYEPFTEDDHLHEPVTAYEPEVKDEYVYEPIKEKEPETHDEPAAYEHMAVSNEPETAIEGHSDYFVPQSAVTTPHAEEEDDFIFHSVNYPEQEESEVVVEEEEEPRRRYIWLWITLIILAIAGAGVFGWFYYQQQQQQVIPVKKLKAAPAATSKDTIDTVSANNPAKVTPVADSAANKTIPAPAAQNTPASTIDSTKRRYEIIAAEPKTQKEADKVVKNYQSIGIKAHVVTDAPGKRKKVSLGTYNSQTGVTAAMNDLIKTGKVNKDIWQLQINPKK